MEISKSKEEMEKRQIKEIKEKKDHRKRYIEKN